MKTLRKLLVLLLLALPAVVKAQFTFTTNNGEIIILGYTGPGGSVIIPDTIDNLPVTSIGDSAFYFCTSLTSVTIPDSVTNIGYWAFSYCTSLTNVTIGNSVTSIGYWAFAWCTNLTSVTIPNSVTNIGDYAFSSCTSLTSVFFQGDAPAAGWGVFSGSFPTIYYIAGKTGWTNPWQACPTVAEGAPYIVSQPANQSVGSGGTAVFTATTVGSEPFSYQWRFNGTNLTDGGRISGATSTNLIISTVQLSDAGNYDMLINNAYGSVTSSVATLALTLTVTFFTCITDNRTITITRYTGPGGAVTVPSTITGLPVTSIGDYAFGYCTSLTSVTIPNSVTRVGDHTFYFCTNLSSVTIPDSVTSIGDGAFDNCTSLTSVTIPDSVTNIGDSAFYFCTSLTSVTIPNSVTNIGDQAFNSCTNLTSVTIGTNVTRIGTSAFNHCRSLISITIPNSVTSLSVMAFSDCILLTDVTIPNSVTSIGGYAFAACTSLTNVTIGNSVTSIGDGAFDNCTSLTSVTIPNSVTNIGYRAFDYCYSLTAIMVDALNSFYSSVDGVLFNKSTNTLIQCPGGKAGSYTIPDSVTNIGYYAFAHCESLTNVTIGNSVTRMGDHTFYFCTNLSSVTIPDSVTSIGDGAFAYCISLTNATIGNSVTNIGDNAFYYCTSLTSITIPNSVTSIGYWAFSYCTSLTRVFFQGNVPSLGSYVFNNANNVTIYYLPGTTGWTNSFGGRPAELWRPRVLTSAANIGVQTNQFGFTINWASGQTVVVEATTDLASGLWLPLQTNTLTFDSLFFSDPQWTNHPGRFYRVRSP